MHVLKEWRNGTYEWEKCVCGFLSCRQALFQVHAPQSFVQCRQVDWCGRQIVPQHPTVTALLDLLNPVSDIEWWMQESWCINSAASTLESSPFRSLIWTWSCHALLTWHTSPHIVVRVSIKHRHWSHSANQYKERYASWRYAQPLKGLILCLVGFLSEHPTGHCNVSNDDRFRWSWSNNVLYLHDKS